jgi:hypothetical protein
MPCDRPCGGYVEKGGRGEEDFLGGALGRKWEGLCRRRGGGVGVVGGGRRWSGGSVGIQMFVNRVIKLTKANPCN